MQLCIQNRTQVKTFCERENRLDSGGYLAEKLGPCFFSPLALCGNWRSETAADLAEIYQVLTKNLNLAVRRNAERFPRDFMFQLTKKEGECLRLQFATSNAGNASRGGNRAAGRHSEEARLDHRGLGPRNWKTEAAAALAQVPHRLLLRRQVIQPRAISF